jgi:hypothetical protein
MARAAGLISAPPMRGSQTCVVRCAPSRTRCSPIGSSAPESTNDPRPDGPEKDLQPSIPADVVERAHTTPASSTWRSVGGLPRGAVGWRSCARAFWECRWCPRSRAPTPWQFGIRIRNSEFGIDWRDRAVAENRQRDAQSVVAAIVIRTIASAPALLALREDARTANQACRRSGGGHSISSIGAARRKRITSGQAPTARRAPPPGREARAADKMSRQTLAVAPHRKRSRASGALFSLFRIDAMGPAAYRT